MTHSTTSASLLRRGVWLSVLSLGLALPTDAAAAPCTDYSYETLRLEPPTVYENDSVVEAPALLAALDQVMNSRERGFDLLLWDGETQRGGVFRVEGNFAATPAVAAGLEAARQRTYLNSCGDNVAFAPLLPGRYKHRLTQEDRTLGGAELLIAPGRDVVELRIRLGRHRYRAVYPVRCARFEDDPSSGCAVAEASPEGLDDLPTTPPNLLSWEQRERRLRIQTGVSWSFVGLSLVSTLPTIIVARQCAKGGCFEEYVSVINLPLSATLFVASLIPALIYTYRLTEHRRTHNTSVRLEPGAGGLTLRF